MIMSEYIIFTEENHIGRITLNRPKALNALTFDMIKAMQTQLDLWALDENIHAVVLDAVPGKAFCAGGDVRAVYDAGPENAAFSSDFFWHEYRLNYAIYGYPKPYIVFMDGITMGGGVGISLHSPYTIGSEHFLFAMPETTIGFFPDVGTSYLLSRCPENIGMYLGLTGARLKADDCMRLKLLYAYVKQVDFSRIFQDLVHSDLSFNAHEKVQAVINQYQTPLEQIEELPYSDIHAIFGQSTLNDMMTALEAHPSLWGQETFQLLLKKSPMSLCVTHALLQKAHGKSMKECLMLEYDVARHFLQHSDFYEGIRALLVDKDNKPLWNPATLNEVSEMQANAYFDSLLPVLELL